MKAKLNVDIEFDVESFLDFTIDDYKGLDEYIINCIYDGLEGNDALGITMIDSKVNSLNIREC